MGISYLIIVVHVISCCFPLSFGMLPLFEKVITFMGEEMTVPVNRHTYDDGTVKTITTLLIAEKGKLEFLLNSMISVKKFSNISAFSILCLDCKKQTTIEWKARSFHLIKSQALLSMARFAFREGGPAPLSASRLGGDMRRHSLHMLYREWMKFILLENGVSVLFTDIDICFVKEPPFVRSSEDIIVEGYWPDGFRKGSYSFPFVRNDALNTSVYIVLNNGVALFTSTPSINQFTRRFMGFLFTEVMQDFGFAQTAFMKLMNTTRLILKPNSIIDNGAVKDRRAGTNIVSLVPELRGSNNMGISVRAYQLKFYGAHATGKVTWDEKRAWLMRTPNCWLLPANWKFFWAMNNVSFLNALMENVVTFGAKKEEYR